MDNNENVQEIRVIKPLTKVLSASADSLRRTQELLLHTCLPLIAFFGLINIFPSKSSIPGMYQSDKMISYKGKR
ncbi:MAG: hypothetical protein A2Y97_03520 [Nitrospirae bacterium RBG_13_39_12]|nr:MAG: hypothetical protein A2Y97_03520 [Nitrospirae bacterium RBG_13_39_12]